jgi:hypothetical protein
MSDQHDKQNGPPALAGAPGSAIPFEDNKGNVMQLDGKLTIADLVKMGVKEIRLMPEGSPLPDNWWRNAGSPNAELSDSRPL